MPCCMRLYLDSVAYDETPMKLGIQAVEADVATNAQPEMAENFFGVTHHGRSRSEVSIVKLWERVQSVLVGG